MAKREASMCARQREIGRERERKETGGRHRGARVCNRRPAVSDRARNQVSIEEQTREGRRVQGIERRRRKREGDRSTRLRIGSDDDVGIDGTTDGERRVTHSLSLALSFPPSL